MASKMVADIIPSLLERLEGPLPKRIERGKEIWRLELTLAERNALTDVLYAFQSMASE